MNVTKAWKAGMTKKGGDGITAGGGAPALPSPQGIPAFAGMTAFFWPAREGKNAKRFVKTDVFFGQFFDR
jgi:hypothetical protein